MLLLRIKGRSLAALGAAITLFALAMDPFFQQLVVFTEQSRIHAVPALIPRTNTYRFFNGGSYFQRNQSTVETDPALSALAFRYFYDKGTETIPLSNGGIRPSIPLTCPSGNCTWTKYESLGICNRCADIADSLEFHCRNSTLDWIPAPVAIPDLTNWDYPNGTTCGWYLMADDPILMAGYMANHSTNYTDDVLVSRSQPIYDLFSRDPIHGYVTKLNDTRNPIAHFVIASGSNVVQVRQNSTPIAHECMLSVSKPTLWDHMCCVNSNIRLFLQKYPPNIQSLETICALSFTICLPRTSANFVLRLLVVY